MKTYLIIELISHQIMLMVIASKSNKFQPVAHIWLASIDAEFHIAMLVQDLD